MIVQEQENIAKWYNELGVGSVIRYHPDGGYGHWMRIIEKREQGFVCTNDQDQCVTIMYESSLYSPIEINHKVLQHCGFKNTQQGENPFSEQYCHDWADLTIYLQYKDYIGRQRLIKKGVHLDPGWDKSGIESDEWLWLHELQTWFYLFCHEEELLVPLNYNEP